MNLPHAHLVLNHIPIIGTLITLGVFLVSLVGKRDDLKQVSLILFALIALLAIPAYMSGSGAQQALQRSTGISSAAMTTHQGAAFLALTVMELTGLCSLMALWKFSRTARDPWMSRPAHMSVLAVLVLAIAAAGLMGVAGNTGGDIRHVELGAGEESSSIAGSIGSRLILAIEHVVIDESMWVWPIIEDLHFVGLILLVGSIGVINLRILGCLKRLPIAPLHGFLPWAIAGFALQVFTGFLMYLGMPGFYNPNFVFQLKMLTILVAGVQVLLCYCTSAFRSLERVGPGEDAPAFAKVMAATSLVLWIAVIILGRYIPFGEVT